jgi:hypothetical protein
LAQEAGEFNSVNYACTTQPWALEMFNRPEVVDGLLYRSSSSMGDMLSQSSSVEVIGYPLV